MICIFVVVIGATWNIWTKSKEMSDEEYIEAFQKSKEDFLVVAHALVEEEAYININLDTKEITGNEEYLIFAKGVSEEFFNSLQNIKDLKIVHSIYSGEKEVSFLVQHLNKNYRGGYLYTSQEREEGTFCRKMESKWFLEILPNT